MVDPKPQVVKDEGGALHMQLTLGLFTARMPLPSDFITWPDDRARDLFEMAVPVMLGNLRQMRRDSIKKLERKI